MEEFAIKVENVSKSFKLPHEKQSSLKGALINFHKRGYEVQEVLRNIDFEIKKGEFFGIVGRNGSGKSTLLKLIAGIYAPDAGEVHVRGSLTPFIELGVGFNPELTGKENVFLNGALLGLNRKDMESMYDEIVEFAELERFMDQKLKNYSSGMQVRLAFSIAIRVESDILVLDEVLAVGDAAFQKKCLDYFGRLKSGKQTVVFISHDMSSMQKYCDRIAWIESGDLQMVGSPRAVTEKYMELFIGKNEANAEGKDIKNLPLGIASAVDIDKDKIKISKVWVENSAGDNIKSVAEKDETYTVKFQIEALDNVEGIVPGLIVANDLGEFVSASNSAWGRGDEINLAKGNSYTASFIMMNILEKGQYYLSVNVVSKELNTFYAWKNKATRLDCNKVHMTGGKVNPSFELKVEKD